MWIGVTYINIVALETEKDYKQLKRNMFTSE
jgi:predicted transcriptional regulator